MSDCGAVHPEHGILCNRPGDGLAANHAEHTGFFDGQFIDWPNDSFVSVPTKEKKGKRKRNRKLTDMAQRVRDEEKKRLRHYIPSETDARGRVALYLLKYPNEWINASELEISTVGGGAAVRKIKELINFGWEIETRSEGETLLECKLAKDPTRPLWKNDGSVFVQ